MEKPIDYKKAFEKREEILKNMAEEITRLQDIIKEKKPRSINDWIDRLKITDKEDVISARISKSALNELKSRYKEFRCEENE